MIEFEGHYFNIVNLNLWALYDIKSNPPPYPIKDSKKCSPKVRVELRKYIEENSIAYCVEMIDTDRIDKLNKWKDLCLGVCLSVPKDLTNCWTDMVLL